MTQKCSEPLRMVVLISGRGSNLKAFIENIANGSLQVKLVGVISNRHDAAGLEFSHTARIPVEVVDHSVVRDRSEFDRLLLKALEKFRPDLIVLAGFMHVLDDGLVNKYSGKILNVHPSLLPLYRGLDTYRRALEAGDSYHGTSIHFVTCELDGGPVVLQVRIAIGSNDNESSLASRIQACEHIVYSMAVNWFAEGRLKYTDEQAILDGKPLLEPVIMNEHDILDGVCEPA
ncbi:MAG: phosphoribosylglycinamide formyltransferase [Gammaproteobacteria bacterium]